MAGENAAATLASLQAQWQADTNRQTEALGQIQEALGLAGPAEPDRVFRHLHPAGHVHRGQHGGLCQGCATQERLPPLQRQGPGQPWANRMITHRCAKCCGAAFAAQSKTL